MHYGAYTMEEETQPLPAGTVSHYFKIKLPYRAFRTTEPTQSMEEDTGRDQAMEFYQVCYVVALSAL